MATRKAAFVSTHSSNAITLDADVRRLNCDYRQMQLCAYPVIIPTRAQGSDIDVCFHFLLSLTSYSHMCCRVFPARNTLNHMPIRHHKVPTAVSLREHCFFRPCELSGCVPSAIQNRRATEHESSSMTNGCRIYCVAVATMFPSVVWRLSSCIKLSHVSK